MEEEEIEEDKMGEAWNPERKYPEGNTQKGLVAISKIGKVYLEETRWMPAGSMVTQIELSLNRLQLVHYYLILAL